MAKDTAQWSALADVIYQYIDQAKLTVSEFRRLWTIGVRGVEELGMDVHATPKTVKLSVKANKTVDLPSDYISYSKIGVLNPDGEVSTLRKNPNLTSYRIDMADRLSKNTDSTSVDSFRLQDLAYVNYFDGARYVNIFGAGALLNAVGEFNIDEEQGLIYLDNDFDMTYIIMEYLSSPADDVDYKIPIQVRDAILAYIAWKDIEYMPTGRRVNLSEKQIRRREFYNQKRLSRLRVKPVTPWDANEVIRMGQKLVAKA